MWKDDLFAKTTVLAGGVTDFNVTAQPAPPMSELVSLSITAGSGRRAVTLRSAAHPRQAMTDLVGIAERKYILMSADEVLESR